jgi:hypothetical protein
MSNIDLELQDNASTPLDNSRNVDPPLPTAPNSSVKHHFHRMSGYFNILDRVFHYKRMSNGTENHEHNAASSSASQGESLFVDDANDGVFSNLSAKPESSLDRRQRLTELLHQQLQNQEGNPQEHIFNQTDNTGVVHSEHVSNQGYYNINQLYEQLAGNNPHGPLANGRIDDGEIESNDKPPSYEDAHNDTVPSYWDLSPEGSLYYDEICVNGLPAGSVINFVWNCVVSASFQFFGFLLSYILHTSHAAKEGSRCGLGITFIALGLRTMPNNVSNKVGKGKEIPRYQSLNPANHDLDVFVKGFNTGSLTVIDEKNIMEEKKNEKNDLINDFKAYVETHYTPNYEITTRTLESQETKAFTKRSDSSPMDAYVNTNSAEFVKADAFESTLSHGSEEKYDHTRNITMMKILAIVLFISGGLLIIQSIYQYYKVKKTEAKLVKEQERLDVLRERYYEGRSVPLQEGNE